MSFFLSHITLFFSPPFVVCLFFVPFLDVHTNLLLHPLFFRCTASPAQRAAVARCTAKEMSAARKVQTSKCKRSKKNWQRKDLKREKKKRRLRRTRLIASESAWFSRAERTAAAMPFADVTATTSAVLKKKKSDFVCMLYLFFFQARFVRRRSPLDGAHRTMLLSICKS